ncbi:MAG: Integrase, catalytic region [Mycobacterium sp.]|nr:Integrase, catalytic region [Mycobacterium sp.]
MAPSTYYAAKSRSPSQRAQRDAVLGPALVQLRKDNYRVYGAASCGRPPARLVMIWAGIRWPG